MARVAALAERPLDISDERWAEAVRREPAIRPLAARDRNGPASVAVAARELGLSKAQVYRLIKAFRAKPVTQSLVTNKPGPRKGTRLLQPEVEAIIEEAIDTVFKRRERPSQRIRPAGTAWHF